MKIKVMHVAEILKGGVSTVICAASNLNEVDSVLYGPVAHREYVSLFQGETYYYERSGRNILSLIRFFFGFIKVYNQVKPDVIHLHSSLSILVSCYIWLASLFNGAQCKVIYQPHGISYDMDMPQSKTKEGVFKIFERFFSVFVNSIIAISKYEMAQIQKLHRGKLVHLLYNGVKAPVNELSTSDREGYLFVGRFNHQKGVDLLIDCWEKNSFRDTLHIVGEPVDCVFDCVIPANVKLHGWVDQETLDGYYSKCKALIVPSRWEGFGLIVAEAFRNRTPVIVSDRGALPEIVDDGIDGYVFSLDAIQTALGTKLEMLNEANQSNRMGESGFRKYSDMFSQEIFLKNLLAIYALN